MENVEYEDVIDYYFQERNVLEEERQKELKRISKIAGLLFEKQKRINALKAYPFEDVGAYCGSQEEEIGIALYALQKKEESWVLRKEVNRKLEKKLYDAFYNPSKLAEINKLWRIERGLDSPEVYTPDEPNVKRTSEDLSEENPSIEGENNLEESVRESYYGFNFGLDGDLHEKSQELQKDSFKKRVYNRAKLIGERSLNFVDNFLNWYTPYEEKFKGFVKSRFGKKSNIEYSVAKPVESGNNDFGDDAYIGFVPQEDIEEASLTEEHLTQEDINKIIKDLGLDKTG